MFGLIFHKNATLFKGWLKQTKQMKLSNKESNTDFAIGILLLFMLYLIATMLTSCTPTRKTVSYKYVQTNDTITESLFLPHKTK